MKKRNQSLKRRLIQFLSAGISNPFWGNFFTGRIYKGPVKKVCLPGLNCYSCPAALGSCPIGALQTVGGSNRFHLSYYVLGFLIITGTLVGRVICGFFCLFGLIQDLLYQIPLPKLKVPGSLDHSLRYLKYLVLIGLVILMPMLFTNEFGQGEPFFCQYLCPAGTIEGGIPLLLSTPSLRQMAGGLFLWKLGIALFLLLASMMIYRPFCRYLCPLGACYGLFNRISFLHIDLDQSACTHCKKCEKSCPMDLRLLKNVNSAECIRCGQCIHSCPEDALKWSFKNQMK